MKVLQGESAITDPDGFWSLVHRYYDPTTGQFLSADPLAAVTEQSYGYANEDPMDATDPSGLCTGPDGICALNLRSSMDMADRPPCSFPVDTAQNDGTQWLGYNLAQSAVPTLPGFCYSGMGCACPQGHICPAGLGLQPIYGPPAPLPPPPPGSNDSVVSFIGSALGAVSTALGYASSCAVGAAYGAAVGTALEPVGGTVGLAAVGCGVGLAGNATGDMPPDLPSPVVGP